MPVVYEDFIRCECGSGDFVEESVLTLAKTLKKRDDKEKPLDNMSVEYHYKCKACGKPLDK